MRKTKKVNRRVEQAWGELGIKINFSLDRFEEVREVGDVDEGDDVESELEENRQEDIEIEDIAQWPLPG